MVFIVLLWTETFTPAYAVQTPQPACEKQEVKQAGEVVCVSLLNTTEVQSMRSLTFHPKPEIAQQITAVGAV